MNVASIETAIRFYYEKYELGTKEIRQLFGGGQTTLWKLKKMAQQKMAEKGVMPYKSGVVDIRCAYEAWGLDISDLEHRYDRLCRMRKKEGSA